MPHFRPMISSPVSGRLRVIVTRPAESSPLLCRVAHRWSFAYTWPSVFVTCDRCGARGRVTDR